MPLEAASKVIDIFLNLTLMLMKELFIITVIEDSQINSKNLMNYFKAIQSSYRLKSIMFIILQTYRYSCYFDKLF